MHRIKQASVVLISISLFLTFGCTAKRNIVVDAPLTSKLSNYQIMKIEPFYYDSSVEIEDQGKADTLKKMFQERVKYNIYNLTLFEKVVDKEPVQLTDKVILLKGRITYMKRLTKTARIMLGAMAGRAGVAVNIHLVDAVTGDTLGEADIEGKSSGGTIFAGGTEQAFEEAAEQIAEFIKNNY